MILSLLQEPLHPHLHSHPKMHPSLCSIFAPAIFLSADFPLGCYIKLNHYYMPLNPPLGFYESWYISVSRVVWALHSDRSPSCRATLVRARASKHMAKGSREVVPHHSTKHGPMGLPACGENIPLQSYGNVPSPSFEYSAVRNSDLSKYQQI